MRAALVPSAWRCPAHGAPRASQQRSSRRRAGGARANASHSGAGAAVQAAPGTAPPANHESSQLARPPTATSSSSSSDGSSGCQTNGRGSPLAGVQQPSRGAVSRGAPSSAATVAPSDAATAAPSNAATAALPAALPPAAAVGGEEEEEAGEPYSLVQAQPLAGGTLHLTRLEGGRLLRVWLPPGYCRTEAARHPYPLLLLNDGQNLFEDGLSFSGCSWRAAHTAAQLIASGQLPPFIVAGIDHAGPNRSLEYLPAKPGSGPGGFRADAANWPGGEVAAYTDRVFNEILPWIQQQYGTGGPQLTAFGGSSFGGICTLWACMHHAGRFDAALVESPSLWFNDERFLREDLPRYTGAWPQRLFLGMGDAEYSGTRAAPAGAKFDRLLASYCKELAALLERQGLGSGRLMWQIGKGHAHTESAWAERLPGALAFLGQPWWARQAAQHAQHLFFTSPRRLRAGQPATLFVQPSKSVPLAGHSGSLRARIAFNNWEMGGADLEMRLAPQLEPGPPAAGESAQQPRWQAVSFEVPAGAYESHFVLTDGSSFDNNAGSDFYVRVSPAVEAAAAQQSPEEAVATARAAVQGPADALASRSASRLFFTAPEALVAGAPAVLYFNRARSEPLRSNPNVKAHVGFNDWEAGVQDLQLAPTSLWRSEGVEWWATQPFEVPEGAHDLSFCFTDGHGCWDNNHGLNFSVPVVQPKKAAEALPRTIASMEVLDHAGGKLHIIHLTRREGSGRAAKDARWKEEKVVRVWTPAGYSREGAPPGGWPVLWMNDGQNMFEDWVAHQGAAWNVGFCAAHLIGTGQLPPFVVAAVDSAGPMRSFNLLPYPPGTGLGGFRGDAERWPGGGCEGYMRRLVAELMPLVAAQFGTTADPARVAFGGGSFAGVTALYAAMHYPHVFGAVLAESPSLWIAEGRFLRDLWEYRGRLPERVFLGCGTLEYSATRDHERPDVDAYLLQQYCEAARALEAAGLRGPQRLMLQIEEGAGHHEKAWAWRLSGALSFLLGPWRDEA